MIIIAKIIIDAIVIETTITELELFHPASDPPESSL
jgi:hypothetical protein